MQHKNLYSYSGTFTPKSDLSLAALYWHVVACEICGHHIMGHMFNSAHDEFEYTKGVIRIRISKKDRQHKCKKKRTNEQTTDCLLSAGQVESWSLLWHDFNAHIVRTCCVNMLLLLYPNVV